MRTDSTNEPAVGLCDVEDSTRLTEELIQARRELQARIGQLGGIATMRACSDITDALIEQIFDVAAQGAQGESAVVRRKAMRQIAIAAVGGYGRTEMAPFSDIDVVFLVGGEEDEDIEYVIKRAFRLLMDVTNHAGLSVGYSYRRVDDVEHIALETQTALLDARLVAGSQVIFSTFCSALEHAISPAAFVLGHIEARQKAAGEAPTPYMVEPDIKDGPGGLRDMHAARWISQVAFGLPGSYVWSALRSKGILLDNEVTEIAEAQEFLCCTRNALHLAAGHGLEILSISRQGEVAQIMGYFSMQEFISRYYASVSCMWRMFRKVSGACLQADLQVEPGIVARNGRLYILDRGLLARDNEAIVRIFQYMQCYQQELARETQDLVCETANEYRITPDAGRCFLGLLAKPGAAHAVREMANAGVLRAIVPQFADLMHLVPGDAAHLYTVGEHCLRTVESIEALLVEKDESYSEIASQVQHQEVLVLAALLHDIGKLDSSNDHAKTGALRAIKIAAMLGLPDDACKQVEFLVKRHLVMSNTARLRDLQQKKTISDFAAIVREPELLDMLLLLSVADARSVGTSNWSQVQIRFLLELYDRTLAALRSPGSSTPDIERHRKRVRRELALANLPPGDVDEHCASMPAGYLLNTSPDTLAQHIGFVQAVRGGTPAVDIKDGRGADYTEMTIAAFDKPGLLSDVTGVLHAVGVDVHAAQIFTRHAIDHIAIDTLYIDFEGRQLSETKKRQLEGDLLIVLAGEQTVEQMLLRWGKKRVKRPDALRIRVLENLSEHETVLEIRADDAPGLLHYLTLRMSQLDLDIHSARVATWGREAQDAFYITNKAGTKLTSRQVENLIKAL